MIFELLIAGVALDAVLGGQESQGSSPSVYDPPTESDAERTFRTMREHRQEMERRDRMNDPARHCP